MNKQERISLAELHKAFEKLATNVKKINEEVKRLKKITEEQEEKEKLIEKENFVLRPPLLPNKDTVYGSGEVPFIAQYVAYSEKETV